MSAFDGADCEIWRIWHLSSGNLQYGLLCGRIAQKLGFVTPHDQTYTIASVSTERDRKGAVQWQMDDVVVKALEQIGWFSQIATEETESAECGETTETERKAVVKARVGEGIFRTDLMALWGSCAVTACPLSKVLVASHIVPWAQAKSDQERLDPFNGLLLTPNLDKLLDLCLISFNNDGSILLSKALSPEMKAALGINSQSNLRFVRPANLPYMERHRRLFHKREKANFK